MQCQKSRNTTKFVYDAFGRLREVRDRWDSSLIAEYRYNGLGFQIAVHEDTDTDGDVDGSDLWYYNAFDEAWRKLATFRGSDTSPKEEFVPHMAGFGGYGGSSYINDVVLRNKDADKAWTVASDGDLEEQYFYCSNWRGDVVMLLTGSKYQVEQVRYSAYGVSFAIPAGDLDSDGEVDVADLAILSGWISTPYEYHYQGDFNLDGFLDSTDIYLGVNVYAGASGGRGVLSWKGNKFGFAGMLRLETGQYLARHRVYDVELGRWTRRDPVGYWDGNNLYSYVTASPIVLVDSNGLWGEAEHEAFGSGNPDMDYTSLDHGWTSPLNYPISTWRHFRDLSDVEEDMREAVLSCDWKDFEEHAHEGQDYFAHYSQGYRWLPLGHIWASEVMGKDVDGQSANQEMFDKANNWTLAMELFWRLYCGDDPKPTDPGPGTGGYTGPGSVPTGKTPEEWQKEWEESFWW